MAGESQFTIGATASCTDGHCGEVRRLIIDPATDTVTHLVIQPGDRQEAARLVPVHLAEATDDGIRLRCTLAEFDKLDHAAERDLVLAAVQRDARWGGCVVAGERGFRGGSGCGGVACDDTVSVSVTGRPSP